MPITDIHYNTYPVDSVDQAVSLASYLNSHGVDAVRDGPDAVTCPVGDDDQARQMLINQLRKNWWLFWENSDRELFTTTPIFSKTCGTDGNCLHCGAGPVVR